MEIESFWGRVILFLIFTLLTILVAARTERRFKQQKELRQGKRYQKRTFSELLKQFIREE